jgi:hypothetical protein
MDAGMSVKPYWIIGHSRQIAAEVIKTKDRVADEVRRQ